jgi:hypothetical protein
MSGFAGFCVKNTGRWAAGSCVHAGGMAEGNFRERFEQIKIYLAQLGMLIEDRLYRGRHAAVSRGPSGPGFPTSAVAVLGEEIYAAVQALHWRAVGGSGAALLPAN